MKPTDRDAPRSPMTGDAPEATLTVADQYSLDDVLDRLWLLAGERVRLAVPAGSSHFLTANEFRQLREIADHQDIDLTLETEDPLRVQLAGMFGLPAVRLGGPLGPRRLPPRSPDEQPAPPANGANLDVAPSGPPVSRNGHAVQPAAGALPDLPGRDADGKDPRDGGDWDIENRQTEGRVRFREPGQPFTLRPVENRQIIEFPTRAEGPTPAPELPKPVPSPVVAPRPPATERADGEGAPAIAAAGAGAGRFAALRSAAERRAARERGRQGLGRPALALLGGAVAVLLLGFVALFVVLPRATVTLQLRAQTVVAEASFVVLPPGEEAEPGVRSVAGTPQTVDLVYRATVETTGVAKIGDRAARGTILLANPGDRPVTIEAGTVGEGDTGLQFRFTSSVTVPAAANGAAGQVDAEVEMVTPGTVGNLGVGQLSGRLDSGVYFSNRTAALSGGTDIETRGVAQADLDALSERFERDRAGLAEARFAETLPAGSAVAAASITYGEPEVRFDHAAGEPAESVTMTVSLTATGLVFDADALLAEARPLLEAELQRQVPNDYLLDPGEIAFSAPRAAGSPSDERPRVVVTAAGQAIYRFEEDERAALADRLSGKSAGEAEEILNALPAVESFAVDYFPGLIVERMPGRASRIDVVVAE